MHVSFYARVSRKSGGEGTDIISYPRFDTLGRWKCGLVDVIIKVFRARVVVVVVVVYVFY